MIDKLFAFFQAIVDFVRQFGIPSGGNWPKK